MDCLYRVSRNSKRYRTLQHASWNGKGNIVISLHYWRNFTGSPSELESSIKYYCSPFVLFYLEQPTYLSKLLLPYTPTRTLRSSHKSYLTVSNPRLKTYGYRSFNYSAAYLWNKLPDSVRTCSKLSTFKRTLKTHIFSCLYFD